jgi:hypothetical protein
VEKVKKINATEGRKLILKAIADYRKEELLATLFREFLLTLKDKKIDKRAADKFHLKLIEEAQQLKVARVTFVHARQIPDEPQKYAFTVHWYEMPARTWHVTLDKTGLRVDEATLGDAERWKQYGDYLEANLKEYTLRAERFNKHLAMLKEDASFCIGPDGLPIHPLVGIFSYYSLEH